MSLSNDLISQFVKVTKDNKKVSKETTVYGTIVEYSGSRYVKLDGSDLLTPISTTADSKVGDRVTVMIKNHSATVTGNLTSPSASSTDVKKNSENINELQLNNVEILGTLEATRADITELEADNVLIKDTLTATEADISILKADNAEIKGTLTATNADISLLKADNAEIKGTLTATNADIHGLEATFGEFVNLTTEQLSAANASIENLETNKLDASEAMITYASISDLEATNANIVNLQSSFGEFKNLTASQLLAVNASIESLQTDKISAKDIEGKFANIDFSNITAATIEKFYATSGLIKDATIENQTITGHLSGVTISGDLIEANTIVAGKLVIKGEDGLYHSLNVNGETVEAQQTDYNSLNGSAIKAKSITASKISVSDLVAFGATIGGFHLTSSALYSGTKSTVENTTRGIYLDSAGQMGLGDATNYIKYYKDSSGSYKLDISADEITFGSKKINLASALEEFVVGTQTAVTGAWTGVAKFSALTDGQRIAYWLPYAGSGNATLNLTLADGNTTGAIACYYGGTTRLTTHYPAGSVIHFVYRKDVAIAGSTTKYTGWWADANYDSGNTYDRTKYAGAIKAGSAIAASNIIVGNNGTYSHLKTGNAFDVTYPILYAASALAAAATGSNNYLTIPFAVTTTQALTMTAYKPVYIKGKLTGSSFKPVSTTPLTQTVPTTADGYQYILLGTAYSTTNLYLAPEHPIYEYSDGKFRLVSQVTGTEMVSMINQTADTITIAAKKINLKGYITSDMISTKGLIADKIIGGTLKLGGNNNGNGSAQVYNVDGALTGILDNKGIVIQDPDGIQTVSMSEIEYDDGNFSIGGYGYKLNNKDGYLGNDQSWFLNLGDYYSWSNPNDYNASLIPSTNSVSLGAFNCVSHIKTVHDNKNSPYYTSDNLISGYSSYMLLGPKRVVVGLYNVVENYDVSSQNSMNEASFDLSKEDGFSINMYQNGLINIFNIKRGLGKNDIPTIKNDENILRYTGTLQLTRTIDASGTVDNKPALMVGDPAGAHIEMDGNEIMAKATGTSVADLYLNASGGGVYINNKKVSVDGHTHSYLPLSGGTVTGTLILSRATDADGWTDNKPALIIGGATSAQHLEFDGNEIMSKAGAAIVGSLGLNGQGGKVLVNGRTVYKEKDMLFGSVSVVPSAANTPTSKAVKFDEEFESAPIVVISPNTGGPGTVVKGCGASNVSATGFNAVLTRADKTSTGLSWIAFHIPKSPWAKG